MISCSGNRFRYFVCRAALYTAFCLYWFYCYYSSILVNNTPHSHSDDIGYQNRTSSRIWRQLFSILTSPSSNNSNNVSAAAGPRLVILIISRLQSRSKRKHIRRTWVGEFRKSYYPRVEAVFVSGLPATTQSTDCANNTNTSNCRLEMAKSSSESDLLVIDFEDNYFNLSLKTYLALQFALQRYPRAEYFLKVDDDTILFPANIMNYYLSGEKSRRTNEERTFFCYRHENPKPRRVATKLSKSALPRPVYPARRYPPFCSGHAYLATRSAIDAVVNYARDHLDYYIHLEDVLFTGLLAQVCNVARLHSYDWHPLTASLGSYKSAFSFNPVHDNEELKRMWNGYLRTRINE